MSAGRDFEGRTPEKPIVWRVGDRIKSPEGEFFQVMRLGEGLDRGLILGANQTTISGTQEVLESFGWQWHSKGEE